MTDERNNRMLSNLKFPLKAGSRLAKKLQNILKKTGIFMITMAVLFAAHYVLADGYNMPDFSKFTSAYVGSKDKGQVIDWTTDTHLASYIIGNTTLSSVPVPPYEQQQRVAQTIRIPITAYSSTPDQTWGNPYITASGTRARDGIVAANFLPIGTLIRIPGLYGDKIFVVEDRMNSRYWQRLDIWMPTRQEAKNFGIKYAYIEILQ